MSLLGLNRASSALPSEEEIKSLIVSFDSFHTKKPLTLTDEEVTAARIKERYGFDA